MKHYQPLLLSALVACAAPQQSAPDARQAAGRHCEEVPPESKEECALAGNPAQGHALVLDRSNLRVILELGQTVSGCGQIELMTTLTLPDGTTRRIESAIACTQDCVQEGSGGVLCRDVPDRELDYMIELTEPLLVGDVSVRVSSARGHLQTTELAVRKAPEPPRLSNDVVATPAQDLCAEFNSRPRLSDDEHMRRYGCPPCPCACVNGQITCAPCVRCEGFGDRSVVPPPSPPPEAQPR